MDDDKSSLDVKALCSISLGLIAVGSCHDDLTERMLHALSEFKAEDAKKKPVIQVFGAWLGFVVLESSGCDRRTARVANCPAARANAWHGTVDAGRVCLCQHR